MIKPIISEKSLGLASHGWYTFAVGLRQRKESIAKDVERLFHVSVVTVRTIGMHGKVKRSGRKMVTRKLPDWKKAIVLLKEGQHIDAFEVTQQEEAQKAPKKEELKPETVKKTEKRESKEKQEKKENKTQAKRKTVKK